jgi:5-methylcytosine-specific restriction endonuclease McrA
MSLLLREKADAATEETVVLRGISQSLSIPTVLRLRRYINVPRRGARWSRMAVLRRDDFTCIYCGVGIGEWQRGRHVTRSGLTIDHILPISRGGRNSWGNTACACAPCNQRKGNRLPHEAGMKLLWEPKIPRVDYLVASGEIPESWKFYLEV